MNNHLQALVWAKFEKFEKARAMRARRARTRGPDRADHVAIDSRTRWVRRPRRSHDRPRRKRRVNRVPGTQGHHQNAHSAPCLRCGANEKVAGNY
jgi:hypothetical protein